MHEAMLETDATVTANPVETASAPFVGAWNRLVSTTNWEKGRIIFEWREALVEAAAPALEYSDDAWARRVGGVTGQHVGRLRRVYERFGATQANFPGLFWSHFQAALDWDDAEMWLEGAVQGRWSVARMRRIRWETLGSIPADEPHDREIVVADLDEDCEPAPADEHRGATAARKTPDGSRHEGPRPEGPDFGDEWGKSGTPGASIYAEQGERPAIEFVRPFANLAELPADLTEAFDLFKLAILRHKTDHWAQVSRDDVLICLDALKELAQAPSAAAAPF